jgi:glycosyltransferase involved in cell wall biosynthesis
MSGGAPQRPERDIMTARPGIEIPGPAGAPDAPLFSVVVPHFEGSVTTTELRRALDSLNAQTCRDFEILLYHNGPKSIPFAEELDLAAYPNLACVEVTAAHDGQWGHSLRDRGIREARGRYIVHLSADNLLYPQALESIRRTLAAPRRLRPGAPQGTDDAIVIFAVLMIGLQCDGRRVWYEARNSREQAMILTGYPPRLGLIDCMHLVMRRDLWLGYGGWYDRTEQGDGRMYQRFAQDHAVRYVPEVLGEHW